MKVNSVSNFSFRGKTQRNIQQSPNNQAINTNSPSELANKPAYCAPKSTLVIAGIAALVGGGLILLNDTKYGGPTLSDVMKSPEVKARAKRIRAAKKAALKAQKALKTAV